MIIMLWRKGNSNTYTLLVSSDDSGPTDLMHCNPNTFPFYLIFATTVTYDVMQYRGETKDEAVRVRKCTAKKLGPLLAFDILLMLRVIHTNSKIQSNSMK